MPIETEMLFRVYSRYVPNPTRRDGSAIDRLLTSTVVGTQAGKSAASDKESASLVQAARAPPRAAVLAEA